MGLILAYELITFSVLCGRNVKCCTMPAEFEDHFYRHDLGLMTQLDFDSVIITADFNVQ